MKAICIIPARGGSKRIPRKNVRDFLGKPILEYSIATALKSGIFSDVILSTDDTEIAEAGKRAGAQVPFTRSEENSGDHATTAAVVAEVLDQMAARGSEYEYFCCLYPTAPFVTAEKLKAALRLLQPGINAVVPIVRFSFPIQRAFRLRGTNVELIQPEHITTRSQDLEPTFHDAGQFYFGRVAHFRGVKSMFPAGTAGMEVSELEVQDIDNETDWKLAEMKFQLARLG